MTLAIRWRKRPHPNSEASESAITGLAAVRSGAIEGSKKRENRVISDQRYVEKGQRQRGGHNPSLCFAVTRIWGEVSAKRSSVSMGQDCFRKEASPRSDCPEQAILTAFCWRPHQNANPEAFLGRITHKVSFGARILFLTRE